MSCAFVPLRAVQKQRPTDEFATRPTSDAMSAMTEDMTSDFDAAVERHRRELHVHCYRMLGSFEEAEDAIQETFLRAWRARDTLTDDSGRRAWLYKIATNVCLDALRRTKRQPATVRDPVAAAVPGPPAGRDRAQRGGAGRGRRRARDDRADLHHADPAAAGAPARGRDPARRARLVRERDGGAARHERRLGQQRAPARRARRCATQLPGAPSERPAELTEEEQRLLAGLHRHARGRRRRGRRGADARGHPDHDAAAPDRLRRPRRDRARCWSARSAPRARASGGSSRRARTACPRPRATCARHGETEFRAFKLDVLRCEDGGVAEITTFDASLFEQLGLPLTLAR